MSCSLYRTPKFLSTALDMARWLALLAQLVALVSFVAAKSATGDSVLVVLEKDLPKERFSKFFNGLEGACCLRIIGIDCADSDVAERGYELTFRDPKAEKPVVIEDDVPQFSHVIVFAPTVKCGSTTMFH